LFFIIVMLLLAAVGEYFYFTQRMNSQRRHMLLLSKQLDSVKLKTTRQSNVFSTVNIKYTEPPYSNGYTTENSVLYLSPLEDSPVVYKITKAVKINVVDSAEILNSKWYEVSISSVNGARLKGWMKEAEIKLIVDEASV
jgi:hypothetical protein